MKARIRILGYFILTAAILGCKSGHEAAGDKFLKAGDAANAVMQYDLAIQKGKTSKDLNVNITKAYVIVLKMRASADPSAEILDVIKDTIASLLSRAPHPQNEADFSQALIDIGQKRISMGSPEGAFKFFKAASSLPNGASAASKIDQAKSGYIATVLKDVESDLSGASSDAIAGVLAEYKMNQLALVVGEDTPAMTEVWSKVRKQNLSVYLMYDAEGLVDHVDARINKYGMLIGIIKYTPGAKTQIQAKVWNGTSGPIDPIGEEFKLVDNKGNSYECVGSLGAFKKKTPVGKGEDTKTGGLTFNVPVGAKIAYLELNIGGRISRKYFP